MVEGRCGMLSDASSILLLVFTDDEIRAETELIKAPKSGKTIAREKKRAICSFASSSFKTFDTDKQVLFPTKFKACTEEKAGPS